MRRPEALDHPLGTQSNMREPGEMRSILGQAARTFSPHSTLSTPSDPSSKCRPAVMMGHAGMSSGSQISAARRDPQVVPMRFGSVVPEMKPPASPRPLT